MNFHLKTSDFDVTKYLIDKDLEESFTGPLCSSLSSRDVETAKKVVQETIDLLENADFKRIIQVTIDVGFSIMKDILFDSFGRLCASQCSDSSSFTNLHQAQVPFVKILPEIHHTLKSRAEQQKDQLSILNNLLNLDQVNCFAANVYEAFCNPPKS